MLCTIISDASYCPKSHAAGWGGYCISNRAKHFADGPLHRVASCEHAETLALIHAIAAAFENGVAAPGDHLLLQSDSQNALGVLGSSQYRGGRTYFSPELRKAQATFAHLTIGCSTTFRWVRGHAANWRQEPRLAINVMCDAAAGRHMQAERKRLGA